MSSRRIRLPRALRAVGIGIVLAAVLLTDVSLDVLIVLTLLNLLLKENFPFSHYPMFASFSNFTYYVFLTDERDHPLPLRSFGVGASFLKKVYDTEVRARRRDHRPMSALTPADLNQAGLLTLTRMWPRAPRECTHLRLYQVNLRPEGGAVGETRRLVAEMPRP